MSRLPWLCVFLCACEGGVVDADSGVTPQALRIALFVCQPTTGGYPLDTQCAYFATPPSGRTARCTLTVSDGRAAVEVADCHTSQSSSLRFAQPGNFTVTLTASDETTTQTQSSAITVASQPNHAPQISAFTPTPSNGVVPLTSTLNFTASDPDGSEVTCSIDVGADGSTEHGNLPAPGSQQHTFTQAGNVTVRLVCSDPQGATAQATTVLQLRAPVGDLRISKVEWGQTVVSPSLRLVANKAALVRVHVLSSTANVANVTLEGLGFNGSNALGALTFTAPPSPPTSEQPDDLAQQYTATVPAGWVSTGLQLRLKVDPGDAIAEPDETNNALTVNPTVGAANTLHLTYVPVVYGGATGTVPSNLASTLLRLWPLATVDAVTRSSAYTYTGTLDPMSTSSWGQLLNQLDTLRMTDSSTRHYLGLVHITYTVGIGGIAITSGKAAAAREDLSYVAAHELGHNFGRQHAPCGNAANPDTSFPYVDAGIGTYGYDSFAKALLKPSEFYDLMSYCEPGWVSDYNYLAVQSALETSPAPPGPAAPYIAAYAISGMLSPEGKLLQLSNPLQVMSRTVSEPTSSPYEVELVTRDGRQFRTGFTPRSAGESDALHFALVLPEVGPLREVRVLHRRETLGAVRRPPVVESVPEVIVSGATLSWSGPSVASITLVEGSSERTVLSLWAGSPVHLPLSSGAVELCFSSPLPLGCRTVTLSR